MKGGHLIFQAASNVSCSQLMAASRIWLGYVVCCRVRESLGVRFRYTTLNSRGEMQAVCHVMACSGAKAMSRRVVRNEGGVICFVNTGTGPIRE